jgi:hypothetical protein
VKLKLLLVALASLAATAATPVLANAQVRPHVNMCNWTLAMWVGQNSNGVKTVNVSGSIQLSCGGPWTPPYLVIDRITHGGSESYGVATGMGMATYQCQGTGSNKYVMDGEIPTGMIYTTGFIDCG